LVGLFTVKHRSKREKGLSRWLIPSQDTRGLHVEIRRIAAGPCLDQYRSSKNFLRASAFTDGQFVDLGKLVAGRGKLSRLFDL
jgi:hypothetical protein